MAVNDVADTASLVQLLRRDSVYGRFPGFVEECPGGMRIDGTPITLLNEADPAALPWDELGVDVVIEDTVTSVPARARPDASRRAHARWSCRHR